MTSLAFLRQASEVLEPEATFALSTIKNVMDNKPIQITTTWPDFLSHIRQPETRGTLPLEQYLNADKATRDRQKDGKAIIAGAYSKSNTREQKDLVSLCMVTLDIDDGHYTFDELCEKLEGLEAAVFTSYSHSLDHPKLRAYLPLNEPITTDIKATLERIIDFFDGYIGHLDPACRKPGQLFFMPACPPGGEGHFQYRHLSGILLDASDFPAPPTHDQMKPQRVQGSNRPGDDYDSQASWDSLLEPLGWTYSHSNASVTHFTRPGKKFGVSGTVFHDSRNFYCHTSAPEASPFECGKSYTPFGAYALIHHGGDHPAAAQELGRQGYGEQAKPPVQGAVTDEAPPAKKPVFISAGEFLKETVTINYLVRPLIERDTTGVLFGPSGCAKTFIPLCVSLAVATGGQTLHGRSAKKGMVLYLAGEGHGGLRRRVKAWQIHNGMTPADLELFHVSRTTVNIYGEGLEEVTAEAAELEALHQMPVSLIVVDTLARHIEGDESSNKDMGAFVKKVDAMRSRFPGSVALIVHHNGVSGKMRSRGAGALKAGVDAEAHCDKGVVTFLKMKESEEPDPVEFKLIPLEIGTDDEGEPITSCVVAYGERSDAHKGTQASKAKYTAGEAVAIKALIGASAGKLKVEENGRFGALVGDWRSAFYDLRRQKDSEVTTNTLKTAFSRASESLTAKGVVTASNNARFLASEDDQAEVRAIMSAKNLLQKVQGT